MDSSIYWDISFPSMSLHLQHEHPERHLLCWRCAEHYTRTTESQLNSLVQTTAFNAVYKLFCTSILIFHSSATTPDLDSKMCITSILYVTVQLLAKFYM